MSLRKKTIPYTFFCLLPVAALVPQLASAHGYISEPLARHMMCKNEGSGQPKSAGCKAYQEEGNPGIYEAGGHQAGQRIHYPDYMNKIPDGQVCSVNYSNGKANGGINVLVKDGDWPTSPLIVKNGKVDLKYRFTQTHGTKHVAFYITKENYDPAKTLTTRDLELMCMVEGNQGTSGKDELYKDCLVPSGQTGRHLIFASWPVSSNHGTGEIFTTCADVDVKNEDGAPESSWKMIPGKGLQANEDVKKNAQVIFRLFDNSNTGAVAFETNFIATEDMPKTVWLYKLAEQINATTQLVKAGKLKGGEIIVQPDHTQYDLFAKEPERYNGEIIIYNNDVEPGDDNPIAIPGENVTTIGGHTRPLLLPLDGSNSQHATEWIWTKTSGSKDFELREKENGENKENVKAAKAFAVAMPNATGQASYELQVQNRQGKTDKKAITFTLKEPEVILTGNESAQQGEKITFRADANFAALAGNGPVTYQWVLKQEVQPVWEQSNNSPSVEVNTANLQPGNYRMEVHANDSLGRQANNSKALKITEQSGTAYDFIYPDGFGQYKAGHIVKFEHHGLYECFGPWAANCNKKEFLPGVAVDPGWISQQWKKLQ